VFVFVLDSACFFFVFVFQRTKHLKYCARPGTEVDIWSEDRGISRGMNKFTQ